MLNYTGNESDVLQKLPASNLGGKIGERYYALIYQNYMKLDLEHDFLEYFRVRPFSHESSWKYIGAGKVVSAGSMLAKYCNDNVVLLRSKKFIRELIAPLDEDGYIGTYCRQKDGMQLAENWVMHDMEYMILGFCDHYVCTGDAEILSTAEKMAGFIMRIFPTIKTPEKVACCGYPEAFFALYTITGKAEYLKFAADTRAGNQTGEILRDSVRHWRQTFDIPASHVYVMTSRIYAQLLLYRIEGRKDPGLLEMTDHLRHELLDPQRGAMLVTGSSSQGEHFSYDQNGEGSVEETCATAYLTRWFESQMTLSGDFRFGDIMERTVYNAMHAVMSPDGRKLRYFTPFEGKRAYYDRDTFCCPGNYRRIMAELPYMCYYRMDGGVAVNLYTASKCVLDPVRESPWSAKYILYQETDYPYSGKILFKFSTSFDLKLYLRIPRFCKGQYQLKVNGELQPAAVPEKGLISIQKAWLENDIIELELPMPERWIAGRAMQDGKAAFLRGPQLFCLGTEKNAEALKTHPDFGKWTLDPEPAGEPYMEKVNGCRDGMLIPFTAHADGEDFTVILTEFTDETGIHTYFKLSDPAAAVPDEILEDCFQLR